MKKTLPLVLFAVLLTTGISLVTAQTVQTTYLTQGFQGSGLPAGWSQTTQATDGGWKFGTNLQLQSGAFQIPAHTKFACTNDDACNCNKISDRLITDTLHLAAATAVVLKLDYLFFGYSINDTTEQASIEISTNGGTTWQLVDTLVSQSTTWQTVQFNLTSLAAGQSNVLVSFKYSDKGIYGDGLAIDNILIYQPVAIDAALTSITPVAYSDSSYGTNGTSITLGGTLVNYGATDIVTCDVKWTDGSNTHTYTDVSLIPIAGSSDFSHSFHFVVAAAGSFPVKMWVELAGDTIHNNDTLSTVINGAAFTPVHKLTIEDQTICSSANGFYSARGIVYKDSLARSIYANDVELISIHAADPMMDTLYATGAATALGGGLAWPQIQVDRKETDDPMYIFPQFYKHIGDFGIADIELHFTYDSTSRALALTADTHFAVDVAPSSGSYRLAMVLTEDSVHSLDTLYEQRNAYTGGAYGPLSGAGIDFAAQPPYVPASLMYYMNVARSITGGYTGLTGSIPATVTAGNTLAYNFAVDTIPANYNVNQMRAIVFLVNTTTGQIKNANGTWITPHLNTGITETAKTEIPVSIFPNPFTEQTNLSFRLDKAEDVSLQINNLLGETVSAFSSIRMSSGEHTLTINGNELSSGMYLVTLKAGNASVTKRMVINK